MKTLFVAQWEYYDEEDGEDYEWEYEEEEEEEEAKAPEPTKPAAPVMKEQPKAEPAQEAPRRRERPKPEPVPEPEPPRARLGKSDRNDILEQMKRLQEGYQLDVEEDDDDISYSLSEDDDDEEEEAPVKTKAKKIVLEDINDEDLEDMDLLDPFGEEPVPKKKEVRLTRFCKHEFHGQLVKRENKDLSLTFICVYYISFYLHCQSWNVGKGPVCVSLSFVCFRKYFKTYPTKIFQFYSFQNYFIYVTLISLILGADKWS